MSKLYVKYSQLKKNAPDTVYLFKVGIFYIALEEDATRLSKALKLNIGKLNEDIIKVAFPVSSKDRYVRMLNALEIPFRIVDDTYGVIENYSDYVNNEKLRDIVKNILSLDFDNITFKEAYELLFSIRNDLANIYSEGGNSNGRE